MANARIREMLKDKFVIIGEHGSFVLSQFRHAGYEYYQVARGNSETRRAYLRYFYKFVTNEAFDRKKIYGQGLRGFRNLVPRRAIKLAFNALENKLREAQSLQSCNLCFGNFYSRLLNLHSLLQRNTLRWISKEPPYGRHIKDLYDLIPDCRVVVMVRDGRDTALSMAQRGWGMATLPAVWIGGKYSPR